MIIIILLLCCGLGDEGPSETLLPPMPDFSKHVDYAEWIGSQGQKIDIVVDSHSKTVDCPDRVKPVREFIETVLSRPKAWDTTQQPEVAKWVREVQDNSSKYLNDLPWLVYDPNDASFSAGEKPILLMDVWFPNTQDLKAVVHADIMAALEKNEEAPLNHLNHALTTMLDVNRGPDFISMSQRDRLRHSICLATQWVISNRDLPGGELKEYLARLESVLVPDIREHFIQAMRGECAGMLSQLQWLTWVDQEGVVRYNPAKVKKCFDVFMPKQPGWSMLMRADADPARDARKCREYYTTLIDAVRTTMKSPGEANFSYLEKKYMQESGFANCTTPPWGEKWIPKLQKMEKQRRLDCITLRLLVYKGMHGNWSKSLKDLRMKEKEWFKNPLTGKVFEYHVKDGQVSLDSISIPVWAKGENLYNGATDRPEKFSSDGKY